MSPGGDAVARHALLEAVLARLIPADEHGPGARDTGAAAHLESRLGDAVGHGRCDRGLDWLAFQARESHGVGFEHLDGERQDALLVALERNPEHGAAFELLRSWAIEAFFGVCGPDGVAPGWRLIGYPGPRREWSVREQQLDELPGPTR